MSSALWHFFWDTAAWGGAPPAPSPSPAPPPSDPGAGSGRSRDDYFPANSDFWEAREAYLRSLQQEMALELPVAAVPPPTSIPRAPAPSNPQFTAAWKLPRLLAEHPVAVDRVHSASDMASLQGAVVRLRALNDAIHHAQIARLALDKHIRVTKRNRDIARLKKALAALMAIQALLSLSHRH